MSSSGGSISKWVGSASAAILAIGTIAAAVVVVPAVTGSGASCATSTPNVPDGPDPWGGCFPGPSNTGVPSGTTLTNWAASPDGPECDITVDNTVIHDKTVHCQTVGLTIDAANVQITDSYIDASIIITEADTSASVTVTDSTIDAGTLNTTDPHTCDDGCKGITDRRFDLLRDNVFGGNSGAWCNFDCSIKESYIHGQDFDEGGAEHESGYRQGSSPGTQGTRSSQEFTHNSVTCDAHQQLPDGGCSAGVTGYGQYDDPIQNNHHYHELFVDSPEASYCAYGGNTTATFPNGTGNTFIDNVWQKGTSGHCGDFNAIADMNLTLSGNQFTGNIWDDGTPFLTPDG